MNHLWWSFASTRYNQFLQSCPFDSTNGGHLKGSLMGPKEVTRKNLVQDFMLQSDFPQRWATKTPTWLVGLYFGGIISYPFVIRIYNIPFIGIPIEPNQENHFEWLQRQVDQEWPTWGMMWTSVCGWRFNCPRTELNGNCFGDRKHEFSPPSGGEKWKIEKFSKISGKPIGWWNMIPFGQIKITNQLQVGPGTLPVITRVITCICRAITLVTHLFSAIDNRL